jgi:hypothetical protein
MSAACMLRSQTHGLDPKLGPAWMGDSGLEAHTITSDTVPHRNLIGSDCCGWKKLTADSQPVVMPTLSQLQPFDRRPVLSWTAPAGAPAGTATGAVAWSCELERTPSLAGQLVYFAIKVALPPLPNNSSSGEDSPIVGLWIDAGTGVWQRSCGPDDDNDDDHDDDDTGHAAATTLGSVQNIHRTAGCLRGSSGNSGGGRANELNSAWGAWETISFTARMERSGTARFALHVEGTPAHGAAEDDGVRVMVASSVDGVAQKGVDAAAVVVAPVGSAWAMLHGET